MDPGGTKMKGFSISLLQKLMLGGMCILIIPLMLVSYFSCTKASLFLGTFSKEHSRAMAEQLAGYTGKLLEQELKLANQIAAENTVIQSALHTGGAQANSHELHTMLSGFMGKAPNDYEDIYVTDISGNVIAAGTVLYAPERSFAKTATFKTVQHLGACIGEVTKSANEKNTVVPVLSPIVSQDGLFQGSVVLLLKLDGLIDKFSKTKIGETGYAFMIDKTGLVIAHPKTQHILKLNLATLPDLKDIISKMIDGSTGVDEYRFEGIDKIAGFAPVHLTGWSVGTTQPKSEFLSPVKAIWTFIVIIALVSIGLTLLMVFVFARNITTPLSLGVACAKKMAQGDFTQKIDINRNDEIGTLAAALKEMSTRLAQVIQAVKNTSCQVDSATNEVASGAQGLSQSTQEQATAIEQIAATLEEMSTSIKQNAANTEEGLLKAKNTLSALEKNMELGGDMSSSMFRIMEASSRIEQIISTVNEVAFQTNLLALNAAIEAARAGENGKGFAVVAAEVRSLAQKTTIAAQEIKVLIQDTGERISSGDTLVKQSGTSLKECMFLMKELTQAIDDIATSTKEQASGVDELTRAISEIDSTTQRNSAIVEELASAADNLNMETKDLSVMVEIFKVNSEEAFEMSARQDHDADTDHIMEQNRKIHASRYYGTSIGEIQ